MQKRMIVTLPDHDGTTHYLSIWGKKSIDAAKDHGLSVTILDKDKANRKTLESYLSGTSFNIVLLLGHGNQSSVTGHMNEPLIVAGQNEGKLKSTITYSISCSSADKLGDASIKAGALCYVGYTQDFVFIIDEGMSTHPLDDKIAGLFLEHTSIFMNTVFKGNTVSEAYEKAKKSLWDNITLAESSGSKGILSWLVWDYYAFVAKGDTASRL